MATTPHNNQYEPPPPYHPEALPSPSRGWSAAPPTHGAEAAKVPTQGAGTGCAVDAVGSPVWDANSDPSKDKEMRGELTLGGRG